MGFDVSCHPVDVSFVTEVIQPYLLSGIWPAGLEAQAIRIAKTRYRANAWGLGANRYHSTLLSKQREATNTKPSFVQRLLGNKPPPAASAFDFESHLYVWGRPFFITDAEPGEVSRRIDEYLTCQSEADVDAIAARMLDAVLPDWRAHVEPDMGAGMPSDDVIHRTVFWKMDLLRKAVTLSGTGEPVNIEDGESLDPDELLCNDLPLAMMEFAAHFRPGWMDRGYVWPTRLLEAARLAPDLFETPAVLFSPLMTALPNLTPRISSTIEENYMLGGYLPADRIRPFIDYLQQHREALFAPARRDNWEADLKLSMRKLTEALLDAERRGMAFVEASEIYSGFLGQLN